MPQRYSTEIRGDDMTQTWTLPHGLHDPQPTVFIRDVENRDVSGEVRCIWPSANEVAIAFAEPPAIGVIYRIEIIAGMYESKPLQAMSGVNSPPPSVRKRGLS